MKDFILNENFKYRVFFTSSFKRDYKNIKKQPNSRLKKLLAVIVLLANDEQLPPRFHDHMLSGKWANFHECHISPDWLLVYKKENHNLILTLVRTGTHSEIFGK